MLHYCILYSKIKDHSNFIILEEDLDKLALWPKTWKLAFNILGVPEKENRFCLDELNLLKIFSLCVYVCGFVHDNSKSKQSRNMKFNYFVAYENIPDKFDNGHCRI